MSLTLTPPSTPWSSLLNPSSNLSLAMSSYTSTLTWSALSSGRALYLNTTQTSVNSSDTVDSALNVAYTLTASSASSELVSRALKLDATNNLTGGGAISNLRNLNISTNFASGTSTTTAAGIYIEQGTDSGSIDTQYGIYLANLSGNVANVGYALYNATGYNIYSNATYEGYFNNGDAARLGYDTSHYASFAVNSSGDLGITPFPTSRFVGIGTQNPTHLLEINRGTTGATTTYTRNPTAGTGNYAETSTVSDAVTIAVRAYSSTFTTSNSNVQSGSEMTTDGSGGMSISSTNAVGVIRFYTGGNTVVQAQIDADGNLQSAQNVSMNLKPADDVTVPANYGTIIPKNILIASGKKLAIRSGGICSII